MKVGDKALFCGFEHKILKINDNNKIATIGLIDAYGEIKDSFETPYCNITVLREVK